MGTDVWLLTQNGIFLPDGRPLPESPLGTRPVTAGAGTGDTLAVVVDGSSVWTRRTGRWHEEVHSKVEVYSIARTADGRWIVGTENAQLAWIENGRLRFNEAFKGVPERPLWDTPYGAPPELRSLAIGRDGAIYANVHVGWIVRSTDGGQSWRSLRDGLDRDVHQVATHPRNAPIVMAATAEGFHISHDRGDHFERRPGEMPYLYQRATACFPDRDVYLASTAKHNQGSGARLYRSEDEGRSWTRVRGLPDKLSRNINTHQVALLSGGNGLVVVQDTSLYETEDYGETWKPARDDLPVVNALLPL